MNAVARRISGSLALALLIAALHIPGAEGADGHIVGVRGAIVERLISGGRWTKLDTPTDLPIDGIAYEPAHRAFVAAVDELGGCSFVEFHGTRVIASMSESQFTNASGTSMTPNCSVQTDGVGGVLISAGYGTLGSATSWVLDVVDHRATALGYGYEATTDGWHIVDVQHTYFPAPAFGSAELLAAGEMGFPTTLRRIVPMSRQFAYAAPALAPTGAQLAAYSNTTLVTGRLGQPMRSVHSLGRDQVPYELQWSHSGGQLIALAGREGERYGTLSTVDPRTGRVQTLGSGVSSFTVAP